MLTYVHLSANSHLLLLLLSSGRLSTSLHGVIFKLKLLRCVACLCIDPVTTVEEEEGEDHQVLQRHAHTTTCLSANLLTRKNQN